MRCDDLHPGLAADFRHLLIANGLQRDELHGEVADGPEALNGARKRGRVQQMVSHCVKLRRQLGTFHIITF
jgi:hypothetical protein